MQQIPPPHSVELEESVLFSCLVDPTAVQGVRGILAGPRDFYVQRNAWAWEAIVAVADAGSAVDYVLVRNELERRGQLAEAGGAAYLSGLLAGQGNPLNSLDYARQVADLAERRRTIEAASALAKVAYNSDGSFAADKARIISGLSDDVVQRSRTVTAFEAASSLYDTVAYNRANPLEFGAVRFPSTDIADLDRLLGGVCPGLYAVGAVTHTGKTAFCLGVAAAFAARGQRVLFFSPEMPADVLLERLICARARVDSEWIDSGRWRSEDDYRRFLDVQGAVADWPLLISNARDMREIEATIYRQAPALVIADGIEHIVGALREKTHEARGEAGKWALGVSTDLNIPFFMPMQVSLKAAQKRTDNVPEEADLYASAEVSMVADVVLILHREDRWNVNPATKTHAMDVFLWKHRTKKRRVPGRTKIRFGIYGEIGDLDQSGGTPPPPEF